MSIGSSKEGAGLINKLSKFIWCSHRFASTSLAVSSRSCQVEPVSARVQRERRAPAQACGIDPPCAPGTREQRAEDAQGRSGDHEAITGNISWPGNEPVAGMTEGGARDHGDDRASERADCERMERDRMRHKSDRTQRQQSEAEWNPGVGRVKNGEDRPAADPPGAPPREPDGMDHC